MTMPTLNKFEDSVLHPALAKQGYYQVGNKLFDKKLNALIEASRTKQAVSWNFNKDIFAQQSARPRLNLGMLDLYRQRAQQLRDQYDYLILAYSGGADSDNILKTFQFNGIHLDEVWCDWPLSLVERSGYRVTNSTEPENMPVEWSAVIKPELDKLAVTNPEIKIHVSDAFDGQTLEDAEDSMTVISVPTVYTSIKRYRYITRYLQQFVDQGRSVAVIAGMDKVQPAVQGNLYGFRFVDNAAIFKTHAQGTEYRNIEYFYWTPDMPEIVTEQAHRVWDALFKMPEEAKIVLNRRGPEIQQRKKWFDHLIKTICYPHWDFSKIQVDKSGIFANYHFDRLTQQYRQEKFYQSWAYCALDTVRQLDPQLAYNDKKTIRSDLTTFENFHAIGTLKW